MTSHYRLGLLATALVVGASISGCTSLQRKLDIFNANGRVFREAQELFSETSWVQVMHGQGLQPRGYHGLVDVYPEQKIHEYLESVRGVIANCVQAMPSHGDFIAQAIAPSMARAAA